MSKEPIRIVQLVHPSSGRQVALVQEPYLQLLKAASVYALALEAIDASLSIAELIPEQLTGESVDYNAVYDGTSPWRLLPSFDHPDGPFGCTVSGTGLTHKNSALNRQMMHRSANDKPTDSMVMYEWGVNGGSPSAGSIGTQPEWFYKGNGTLLKAHNEPLEVPAYANDGGEEPEIAGVYVVDERGQPWRLGFTTANEFSDHVMEKKNYLYLAPSKLRNCAIGPELVLDESFTALQGRVQILRNNQVLWSAEINTGESNMAHSLANLEHHHFKYACHRVPLQAHVHFFGADAFSFGSNVVLEEGDMMQIHWQGMGRPLRNPLRISGETDTLVEVRTFAAAGVYGR
ncbi:GguC protein [Segetibacter sp. 3557_3]|uniref:AraD1 family protein n=1 Tax=Segetibacter sp. 3557_3 TaxID=2547429 RepID=UPI001058ED79|nr:AraD1 family protein [Segetibacter sp. 3557_3]TDH27287.1 GguC protein [Segetibacter sp. 3557_3]